jgi:hypothetical protein
MRSRLVEEKHENQHERCDEKDGPSSASLAAGNNHQTFRPKASSDWARSVACQPDWDEDGMNLPGRS